MIDKLIEFMLSVADLFRFWIVVDQDEAGILLRMGACIRELEGGRWYFKLPFRIDVERIIRVTPDTHNLSSQGLMTKDGKQIVVSCIVKFRISDVKKALLEVQDRDGVVRDCTFSVVCTLVQEHDWEEVRKGSFGDKMTKSARTQGFPCGVEILSVKFTDCSTTFNHTQMQVGM
jgi:regulator of protease activity HflC (stomatin/prohibitin superfamily)